MRLPIRSTLFALVLTATAGCEQQPAGDPLVRTSIRTSDAAQSNASGQPQADDLRAQVESSCRPVIFEDTSFTHCLAIPARHEITTAWANATGEPFRSFAAYAASRGADRATVAFAFNGGKFTDVGEPVGYFVQDGERLNPLNTDDGEGDFFSKPNGVFFGDDEEWQILTSDAFLAEVSERPDFGTQSGPMLVIEGKLHPDIRPDGEERVHRNAVGVDASGRAHFVISNAPVSFGKLARLYRDKLEVENALYLDGEVSSLWSPANGRVDAANPLGPLIVVEKRAAAQ